MAVQREKLLQSSCCKFAEHCIDGPSDLMAHDRSKAATPQAHMWEAQRGIRKGTPDMQILVPGLAVFCELKVKGNKPTPAQIQRGEAIAAAGHFWFWATSVTEFGKGLARAGVTLTRAAPIVAADYDAKLEARALRVPKAARKARAPRATKRGLRVASASLRP